MDRRSDYRRRRGRRPQGRPASVERRPVRRRKVPTKRLKRDYTLLVFTAVWAAFAAVAAGFVSLKSKRHFRPVALSGLAVLGLFAAFGIFHLATRPNGVEVYLDHMPMGVVRWENRRSADPDYIERHAIARLQSRVGARIYFNGEIIANPVRVQGNAGVVSFDTLISVLVAAMDYYVYGAKINVRGDNVASVASDEHARELLTMVSGTFTADSDVLRYEFVEEVTIRQDYIPRNELMSIEEAFEVLTTPQPVHEAHIVQPGDTMYTIARSTGMSMAALRAANPGIVNPDVLLPGQRVMVTRMLPPLSVRAFQRVEAEEIIAAPIEVVPTRSLAPGVQSVVQHGQAGLRRVVADIVSINGTEVERRVIDQEIIREATAEIVHLGTAN